jgi:tRNA 2-thiouridine synthesizing protein A
MVFKIKKIEKITIKWKKMADKTLNAIGLKCPMPVLKTKKELKGMTSGQVLELIVDDKGALKDVPALLGKTGDHLLETNESEKQVVFLIQKA